MDRLGDGLVYLCRASGEGSHDFRVCPDEAGVGAFYQEMTGEDEGGGIDSLWRDFRNPDCWDNDGTALELELYCAKFEVWKVDARQLAVANSAGVAPSTEYTGYAVVMDDPNSSPQGFWWVGAWHDKEVADDISKKHGASTHVVQITSVPSATTPRIRCMRPCARHEGIPFVFTAYVGTVATYCPHCEAESAA